MGIFDRIRGKTDRSPEGRIAVSAEHMERLSGLLTDFNRAVGNNNQMWSVLEAIARAGGHTGFEEVLRTGDTERPWRWIEAIFDEAHR